MTIPDPRKTPTISIDRAAGLLGIGRTLAYRLAREGGLPVPVLRVGTRYRVPTSAVLAVLGLADRQGA